MLKHARAEGYPGMFFKVLHGVAMQTGWMSNRILKIVVEKWAVIVYFLLTLYHRNQDNNGRYRKD